MSLDLSALAAALKVDAEELVTKTLDALLPELSADLTPIVVKALNTALADVPFSAALEPVVDDAAAKIVNQIVAVVEAEL
jgi:hypothetical protein